MGRKDGKRKGKEEIPIHQDLEIGYEEVETEFVSAEPEEHNRMVLDYCTLYLDGEVYKGINAVQAGRLIYRNRGFQDNPWDNSVQYKDRIIACNKYGEESGFYHRISVLFVKRNR